VARAEGWATHRSSSPCRPGGLRGLDSPQSVRLTFQSSEPGTLSSGFTRVWARGGPGLNAVPKRGALTKCRELFCTLTGAFDLAQAFVLLAGTSSHG
jgi:hypothetical protein